MEGKLAPILGVLVGGVLGYYVGAFEMKFNPPSILPWFVLGTAVAGGVAGVILWYVDSAKGKGRP